MRRCFCCAVILALMMNVLSAPVFACKQKTAAATVNLNTATALELQPVPGGGPLTADKIVKMRKSYGQFISVGDLRAIKALGRSAWKQCASTSPSASGLPGRRRRAALYVVNAAVDCQVAAENHEENPPTPNCNENQLQEKDLPEGQPLQKQERRSAQQKCANISSEYLVSFFW
jgi:competence ComEA-like helix-hairpin-helix protein